MKKVASVTSVLLALGLAAGRLAAQCDDFRFAARGEARPGGRIGFHAAAAHPGAEALLWVSRERARPHQVGPFTLCVGHEIRVLRMGTVARDGTASLVLNLPPRLPPELNGVTLWFQAATIEFPRGRRHPLTQSSNLDSLTFRVP